MRTLLKLDFKKATNKIVHIPSEKLHLHRALLQTCFLVRAAHLHIKLITNNLTKNLTLLFCFSSQSLFLNT